MKEENQLLILYKCDYIKNKNCRKTLCQKECFYTTMPEYSKDKKRFVYNMKTENYEELLDG